MRKLLSGAVAAAAVILILVILIFWSPPTAPQPETQIVATDPREVSGTVLPEGVSPPTGTAPSGNTRSVQVFYSNTQMGGENDCAAVFPVEREVDAALDAPLAALQALLAGPTEEERQQGYDSFFSTETQDMLMGVKIAQGAAYVNLEDIRPVIPNASASCGSQAFFAQVETTLRGIADVERILYAITGNPEFFYEWMQIGCVEENDFCDPEPFIEITH